MTEQFDYLCAPYAPIDEHSEYAQPINEDCSIGVVPQDATVIGTLTEDGKRKILVSEVATINKPFFDRNRSMMTRYINERLRDGSMQFIVPFAFTTRHITYLQRDYKSAKFWKMDRTHFIADVEVHLKLDTAEGVRVWVGIMTLWVDIEDDFASTIEDFVDKNNLDERDDMTALSSFLIPVYSSRQMDREMEVLWSHYLPEALAEPSVRKARELAGRMGLSIVELPVYNHPGTPTILFFVEDMIQVKDAKSSSKEPPQEVRVPANTIVINTNHRYKDYSEYYIYHECVHYEEHYMFFKLQEMHTNDIQRMKTKVQIVEADEKVTSPLYWMEVQANRGAYGLMLPVTHTEALIRSELSRVTRFRHPGDQYESAGKTIANCLNLPYFRIRARMIQLGHIFAKGSLNKADGVYIEPFSFDLDAWRGDEHTFVIDERTVKAIYDKSPDFRQFIDSRKFIYADGHVVRNTPEYVDHTYGHPRLTAKANMYINRCCLRFVRQYEQRNLEKYVYGRMYYDADYVARTRFYLDDEINRNGLNELQAELEYKKKFPETFRDAFNQLCRRNGMTQDDVADALHISLTSMKDWIKDPENRISADFVMQLMLLWQLPDWLTRLLLDRAYVHLSESNPRHLALLYIMRVMWMDGIVKANEYLSSMGLRPLSL